MRKPSKAYLDSFLALWLATFTLVPSPIWGDDKKGSPMNWLSWRGPFQNNTTAETQLPITIEIDGDLLAWKKSFQNASSLTTLDDTIYFGVFDRDRQQERIVALEAKDGEQKWETKIARSYGPSHEENKGTRTIGSLLAIDDESRTLVSSGGGFIRAIDAKDGRMIWERCLVEEFSFDPHSHLSDPILFEDIIIVGGRAFPSSKEIALLGEDAAKLPARFRLLGLDKRTGSCAWSAWLGPSSKSQNHPFGHPVSCVLNGQAAIVLSGTDNALHAIQPRTGLSIWQLQLPETSNPCPIQVHQGIVYAGYRSGSEGEAQKGSVFAFDGNNQGQINESKLLWKIDGRAVSRIAPTIIQDQVVFVDDLGKLFAASTKSGEITWNGDENSIRIDAMIGTANGLLALGERSQLVFVPIQEGRFDKVRLSPWKSTSESREFAVSKGRLFVSTEQELIAFEDSKTPPKVGELPELDREPRTKDRSISHIQLCPVGVALLPGQKAPLQVRGFNAAGVYIRNLFEASIDSFEQGAVDDRPVYASQRDVTHGTIVTLKAVNGEQSSNSNIRVIPLRDRFSFDDGKVPDSWIGETNFFGEGNTNQEDRFLVANRVPDRNGFCFLGVNGLKGQKIQADFQLVSATGRFGLVAHRCIYWFTDKNQSLSSVTPGVEAIKSTENPGKLQAWYTMKFHAEERDDQVNLKGKVWERGSPEPEAWTLEAHIEKGNDRGAFGVSVAGEIHLDNVVYEAEP